MNYMSWSERQSFLSDPVTGDLLTERAKAYNRRRKTPPMSKMEAAAVVDYHDPDGSKGLAIIDATLEALDGVKSLCRANPNKPKVRRAIDSVMNQMRSRIVEISTGVPIDVAE